MTIKKFPIEVAGLVQERKVSLRASIGGVKVVSNRVSKASTLVSTTAGYIGDSEVTNSSTPMLTTKSSKPLFKNPYK